MDSDRQIQAGFLHVWPIELADKLCFKEKEENSNLIPNLILISINWIPGVL